MDDGIDAIFTKAKQGRVLFRDRSALSPEFIPDHLPFRESQISNIAQVLGTALHGFKPSNLLLYGKTGTGKTAVARLVVRKLQNQDDSKQILATYVNSRIAGTEYRTLFKIAEALPLEEDKRIPLTGLSISEVVGTILRNHL